MAHMRSHHLGGYGGTYYEDEKEVVRGPCDSYSSEYRVVEYADPGYSTGYQHHHNSGDYAAGVTKVVSYESNPGYLGRRHHDGATEVIEKREEIIYDSTRDPYRRM